MIKNRGTRCLAVLAAVGAMFGAGATTALASTPVAHTAQSPSYYQPSDAQINSVLNYLSATTCGHHGRGICWAYGIRSEGRPVNPGPFHVVFNYSECNTLLEVNGNCVLGLSYYYIDTSGWGPSSYATGLHYAPSVLESTYW